VKNCSFCAEEIQDAAIVCKHCGRDVPSTNATPAGALVAGGWTGPTLLAVGLSMLAFLPASPATVGAIAVGGLANAAWIAAKAYGGRGYRGGLAVATLLLALSGGCWVVVMPSDRQLVEILADPTRTQELAAARFLGNSGQSLAAIAFTAALGTFLGTLLYRPRAAAATAGARMTRTANGLARVDGCCATCATPLAGDAYFCPTCRAKERAPA